MIYTGKILATKHGYNSVRKMYYLAIVVGYFDNQEDYSVEVCEPFFVIHSKEELRLRKNHLFYVLDVAKWRELTGTKCRIDVSDDGCDTTVTKIGHKKHECWHKLFGENDLEKFDKN